MSNALYVSIKSSRGDPSVAQVVESVLSDEPSVTCVLSKSSASYGVYAVEALEKEALTFDAAVFVHSPHNIPDLPGGGECTLRDGLMFEFGYCVAKLGRELVVYLAPRTESYRSPALALAAIIGASYVEYDPPADLADPAALRSSLALALAPFKARLTTALLAKPRVFTPFAWGSTSHSALLDCALYIQLSASGTDVRRQLQERLPFERSVPMKYLYMTDEGSQAWLRMCESETYVYFRHSFQHLKNSIERIAQRIVEAFKSTALDVVTLGCGNGEKDRILLTGLVGRLKPRERLSYFPIDISASMLMEAIKCLMQSNAIKNRTDVKAILGDFTTLKTFEPIYEVRPQRNLFSVLGNTLGNSSELPIFEALGEAMFPGDLLLIEVNVDNTMEFVRRDFFDSEIKRTRDLIPLRTLGLQPDSNNLKYDIRTGLSLVPDTRTMVGVYRSSPTDAREIGLSEIHHYKLDRLLDELRGRLDVNVLEHMTDKGTAVILAQKQKK